MCFGAFKKRQICDRKGRVRDMERDTSKDNDAVVGDRS